MKTSVIIPAYNRAHLISRAIDSALSQTYKPLEIIVVDDGSTDDTKKVLAKYSSKVKVIYQQNKGVSAARNIGIMNSIGKWIALLDSDDEWLPDKLESQRLFFLKHSDYHIFQSEEIWIRNGKRVNPKFKHKKYGGWIFKESLPLCIVSPSAVTFKKKIWSEIGKFDEEFPVCEDYDLWLRIARRYPIGLCPIQGVIKYGGHSDQLSRSDYIMDKYRVRAICKHLNDRSFSGDLRSIALKIAIEKLEILKAGAIKRNKDFDEYESLLKKIHTEYNF